MPRVRGAFLLSVCYDLGVYLFGESAAVKFAPQRTLVYLLSYLSNILRGVVILLVVIVT